MLNTQCVGVDKTDGEDCLSLGKCMVNVMGSHGILERAILKWLMDRFKLCREISEARRRWRAGVDPENKAVVVKKKKVSNVIVLVALHFQLMSCSQYIRKWLKCTCRSWELRKVCVMCRKVFSTLVTENSGWMWDKVGLTSLWGARWEGFWSLVDVADRMV